jgi:hypothetical protein
MSTAKGVELAGIIQNEVYQAMLRLAKKQSEYNFYSEIQIDETFTGGLFLRTRKNVLKIFSDLGVLLKGENLSDALNFQNLDYIIISSDGFNSIVFNPEIYSNISEFQFFCKENKFKDYLIADFLRSEEFEGVGNDYDSTLNILPDFILSLED